MREGVGSVHSGDDIFLVFSDRRVIVPVAGGLDYLLRNLFTREDG